MLRTTGMRATTLSHWRSHHWPMKFVATMPVSTMSTSITISPSPGMLRSSSASDASGSYRCSTLRMTAANMPSNMPTSQSSTHAVTTKGSHVSRPAMK